MENGLDRIYGDLFDIMEGNMQAAGKQFVMKKDAFMYRQRSEAGVFDVSLCGECDNASFLQIAYLGMLGRMPDRGAVTKWMKKADLEPAAFRAQLIERIRSSAEFAGREVKIVNNIYNADMVSSSKRVRRGSYIILAAKLKIFQILKKIYRKLPERYRKQIKELLGR